MWTSTEALKFRSKNRDFKVYVITGAYNQKSILCMSFVNSLYLIRVFRPAKRHPSDVKS